MKNITQFSWDNRDLNEQLAHIKNVIQTHGAGIFTELFDVSEYQDSPSSQKEADLNSSLNKMPLKNSIVSIKDLFDVKGYQTRAGSVFLNGTPPATKDAVAVQRLRDAGACFIGHTNMTEIAYSGLGLNPHYGTPQTPLYVDRIAGGSTSGGAVSVALGIADIALGSDTGGSLRIPSAFCGVTGFKPSQSSVSREGSLPLSSSLDSVGPIAKTVSECEVAWSVLSGNVLSGKTVNTPAAEKAHFVVPSNFGLDDLDDEVRQAFEELVTVLKNTSGVSVEEKALPFLDEYKTLPIWQFSAYEALTYYRREYDINLSELDPRVASRLKRAETLDEKTFLETCSLREVLIERYKTEEGNSVLLLPTVAILPPKLAELERDEDYDRINLLCLRNTSLANVLDGCSVSLPYQHQGNHIGIMLTGGNGDDENLLSLSKLLEKVILTSS